MPWRRVFWASYCRGHGVPHPGRLAFISWSFMQHPSMCRRDFVLSEPYFFSLMTRSIFLSRVHDQRVNQMQFGCPCVGAE
eukprot:5716128-Lingulodinium_polyedra.AAC.1